MKIRKHSAQYWKKSGTNLSPIDLTANVGIGTTAPTSRLSIVGSGATSATNSLNVNNSLGNSILVARNDNRVKIGQSADTAISKTLEVAGNFNFDTVANPTGAQTSGMVLTNSGAGSIPAGTYYYGVMFTTADGDTGMAGFSYTLFPSITSASDFSVSISNIPTSTDPRVTGRKIYRSQAGTVGDYYYQYYIGTISDNTTTTYSDNSAIKTTATDWIYNKNNTTAGIIYRDGTVFGRLGDYVTAFGNNAMPIVTRGSTSSAFGSGALAALTTGNDNDAFGNGAVASVTTGIGNAGFGYATLQGNQTGSSNAAFGKNAVRNNSNYSYSCNTGIGVNSLYTLTTNNNGNSALGYLAGRSAQGSYGIYIGYAAGYQLSETTVGYGNIVIGSDSGTVLGSGARNILLGYNVELTSPTTNNQLNIGNLIFATGMDGTGTTLSTGNVGIGTVSPTSKLHTNGSIAGAYIAKTADYTLTINDYLVECTANTFTITLPTAVGITGRIYNIKNTGTGIITVDGNASETIDGETTQTVSQWSNLQIMSNGANWIII